MSLKAEDLQSLFPGTVVVTHFEGCRNSLSAKRSSPRCLEWEHKESDDSYYSCLAWRVRHDYGPNSTPEPPGMWNEKDCDCGLDARRNAIIGIIDQHEGGTA